MSPLLAKAKDDVRKVTAAAIGVHFTDYQLDLIVRTVISALRNPDEHTRMRLGDNAPLAILNWQGMVDEALRD